MLPQTSYSKDILLLLHVLAGGVGVLDGGELAQFVVVVVLHPAVRVLHVDHPAHAVIGVGGGASAVGDGPQAGCVGTPPESGYSVKAEPPFLCLAAQM